VLAVSLLLLASCRNGAGVDAALSESEVLMTDHPDSSLVLLQTVDISQIKTRAAKVRYALLYTQAQHMTDSIRNASRKDNALLIEKQYDTQYLLIKNQILRNKANLRISLLSLSVAVLLIIVLILLVSLYRRKYDIEKKVTFVQDLKIKHEDDMAIIDKYEQISDSHLQVRQLLVNTFQRINKVLESYYQYGNTKSFIQEFELQMSHNLTDGADFSELVEMANICNNGVISRISSAYPMLNQEDLAFISLLILKFSVPTICSFYGYKDPNSVYVRKSRLCKKMGREDTLDRILSDFMDHDEVSAM